MWSSCFVAATRATGFSGPGRKTGSRCRSSAKAGDALCVAPTRKASPSRSTSTPKLAPHRRVAFSSIARNTGSSAAGELEMTLSISEVAVCCSSASLSSRVSRATSVSWPAAEELRRDATFSASRGFSFAVLRPRALTGPLAALERRLIASPVAQDVASRGQTSTPDGAACDFGHRSCSNRRMSQMGHELPRRALSRAAARPPITATQAQGWRGRDGPISDIRTRERPLTERPHYAQNAEPLSHGQEASGSIHLRRTEALFSATAARMRALNAASSIFSPS